MGSTQNSQNTFMYSTDGFNSKTFSSNKLHKRVFSIGKNTESINGNGNFNVNCSSNGTYVNINIEANSNINKKRGKSHKREESIRNLFESQIVIG
jgi:hypothetical protein